MDNKRIVDLKTYLQIELDLIQTGFLVVNERNLQSDFEKDVVISQLVGNSNKYNASISYQLDIYTSDIDNVMEVFEKFSKSHSQTTFEQTMSDSSGTHINTITQNWTTPVVLDKDVEIGANHYSHIAVYGSLYVLFDSSNVKKITIDGEEIDFESGTIAWQNNALSNRVSGRSNNKNFSESSATSLAFLMKSQNGQFVERLSQLRTGVRSRSSYFNVVVELTNGTSETYKMLVQRQVLAYGKASVPNYEVAMCEYEDFVNDVEII